MELKELEQHIRTLATLEPTESPIVSAYFPLDDSGRASRKYITERTVFVGGGLPTDVAADFKHAMHQVADFLRTNVLPPSRGAAVFSRAGRSPFFLGLQFGVPLPSMIAVESNPNIYHLVELKDLYHRYVVVIVHEKDIRIVEVNLGNATKELWTQRPELHQIIDRTWSKQRYHRHTELKTDEFIAESVKMLDRVMSSGGYKHLIVAGNQQMAWRFRYALPYHLSEKFVDVVDATGKIKPEDVAAATIGAFFQREQEESVAKVDELVREIRRDGLAVAGAEASLEALRLGMADVLVIARDFDPQFEVKSEMALLAEQSKTLVEVVNQSEALNQLGGVGCLLRYRLSLNVVAPPNVMAEAESDRAA